MVEEGHLAFEAATSKQLCLVAVAYHNLAVVQLKLSLPDLGRCSLLNSYSSRAFSSYSARFTLFCFSFFNSPTYIIHLRRAPFNNHCAFRSFNFLLGIVLLCWYQRIYFAVSKRNFKIKSFLFYDFFLPSMSEYFERSEDRSIMSLLLQ